MKNQSMEWKTTLTILVLCGGCTHHTQRHARLHRQLEEESRALTTAVVDTLQAQPPPQRDAYAGLALRFAQQDQRIVGLPAQPFDVPALLAEVTVATNSGAGVATVALSKRFEAENKLVVRDRTQTESLLTLGEEKELTDNARRGRWFKWTSFLGLSTGGIIVLIIFCPAAIPVIGRILAFLVAKVPALAGACGVVSVKAFDALVRGIEKSRALVPHMPAIEESLSREMDADHKALVRVRKEVGS
jgi:hypothetical protein